MNIAEQQLTNNIKVPNNDLEILKKYFPHCFDKNGNFEIEKFKNNLNEKEINFTSESYGMDWLGKSYARILANDPTTTLLKADETHNTKPENANSENLLIKGDNLEVLKHLANAYYEKVKMIYIDPPYNTGGDGFVYQDDRKFTITELQQLAGVDEEKAKRILAFTKSESNSHSAWLTFMYPRLYIAKQLLKEDGVIFISIDDNEVAQLRLLMDEIFGEENFVAEMIWANNERGRSIDKYISNTNEYILVYGKNINDIVLYEKREDGDGLLELYNLNDGISQYKKGDPLYNNNSSFNIDTRPNLVYSIYINKVTNEKKCIDEKVKKENGNWDLPLENMLGNEWIKVIPPLRNTNNKIGCWRWGIEKFIKENDKELIFKEEKNGKYMFYSKNRLDNENAKYSKYKNIITNISSSLGTTEVVKLLNDKIFSHPKPSNLIKLLLKISSKETDLILDFFAGSGTTGDAVMQLNAEDSGNRKFILVQLPETIDSKKNKVAYDFVNDELKVEPTIFEITKERLIRASAKIKKEKIDYKGDLGFKIFETTPIWEDYNFEANEFDNQTTLFDESKLKDDDLKTLLTTWKTYDGIALSQDLEPIDLDGYTAYFGNGKLYLMHKGFTTESLKSLLEKIDLDKNFNPTSIITFGYNLNSKNLRELCENVKSYSNKKNIDIDFITRY